MPGIGVLIIVVFLILIIFGAIASHRAREARLAALAQLARHHGWQFNPQKNYNHDEQYRQFSIFCKGDDRYAYNTLTGSITIGHDSWPIQLGDYHYEETTGSGKDRSTHDYRFSYLLLRLPYHQLPTLAIRREGIFDKLAGFIGFDDIDFESAEFSRRFHVKGSDKRFVYDVIHPRMMEHLLATNPLPLEIGESVCCISDGSKHWQSEDFARQVNQAVEFFSLWPEHVTSTLQR